MSAYVSKTVLWRWRSVELRLPSCLSLWSCVEAVSCPLLSFVQTRLTHSFVSFASGGRPRVVSGDETIFSELELRTKALLL